MRSLAWGSSFRRAFKRLSRKNSVLRGRVFQVLETLTEDPYHPSLKTHKLSGRLEGLWACRVEYDVRIIFTFEPDPHSEDDMIVLIDIGSHDEVY